MAPGVESPIISSQRAFLWTAVHRSSFTSLEHWSSPCFLQYHIDSDIQGHPCLFLPSDKNAAGQEASYSLIFGPFWNIFLLARKQWKPNEDRAEMFSLSNLSAGATCPKKWNSIFLVRFLNPNISWKGIVIYLLFYSENKATLINLSWSWVLESEMYAMPYSPVVINSQYK